MQLHFAVNQFHLKRCSGALMCGKFDAFSESIWSAKLYICLHFLAVVYVRSCALCKVFFFIVFWNKAKQPWCWTKSMWITNSISICQIASSSCVTVILKGEQGKSGKAIIEFIDLVMFPFRKTRMRHISANRFSTSSTQRK